MLSFPSPILLIYPLIYHPITPLTYRLTYPLTSYTLSNTHSPIPPLPPPPLRYAATGSDAFVPPHYPSHVSPHYPSHTSSHTSLIHSLATTLTHTLLPLSHIPSQIPLLSLRYAATGSDAFVPPHYRPTSLVPPTIGTSMNVKYASGDQMISSSSSSNPTATSAVFSVQPYGVIGANGVNGYGFGGGNGGGGASGASGVAGSAGGGGNNYG